MRILCDIAIENGSHISLKDLISLTSIDCSEKDLAESWDRHPELSSRYRIASGMVLEKSFGNDEVRIRKAMSELTYRVDRANSNIAYAGHFGALLGRADSFRVLSISGSTSYLSVSETDDLDFFCISDSGRMWMSFVKSLILARAVRFVRRPSPFICLSYVSDENFVRGEFSKNRNGLFARDAISTRVISGEDYFLDLLEENSWMALYFPKLYGLRMEMKKERASEGSVGKNRTSPFERALNLLLFYTAGNYIRLKSYLLNRRFSRDRRFSSLFRLRIGIDHCIYESSDYLRLRKLYSGLERNIGATASR
jgi:hypothetical protein